MKANISFLNDTLAVGGDLSPDHMPAKRQVQDLMRQGVTNIMDVRAEYSDRKFVAEHSGGSIGYFYHPTDDDGLERGDRWWSFGLKKAGQILRQGDTKLFVHCHMGINRAPSMAFAILVEHFGMNPTEAYALIRERRPQAFAIYAPQALEFMKRRAEDEDKADWSEAIRDLKEHMAQDHDRADIHKAIRQVRDQERGTVILNPREF